MKQTTSRTVNFREFENLRSLFELFSAKNSNTKLKNKIPEEKTVRQEELLRSQIEELKIKYKKEFENANEAMKYAEYSAKAKKEMEQSLKKASEEHQKQNEELQKQIMKVQKQIEG